MKAVFEKIIQDPRYQENLTWGKPRKGHPEGTLQAHIKELEENLAALKTVCDEETYWQLKLLIHIHDIKKPQAKDGVAIEDPRSHASLARVFLAEFCQDEDLLNMVQYHDEGYALWLQFKKHGHYNQKRFESFLRHIQNWRLFLLFCIIDGATLGKSRQPVDWFLHEITPFNKADITYLQDCQECLRSRLDHKANSSCV